MGISKFTDIGQYRNLVKDVQYHFNGASVLPVLRLKGSVKLHGTNAGVHLPINTPHSRENVLTIESDNYGFARFHNERRDVFEKLYNKICTDFSLPENTEIVVYGEWAGKGIQKEVGISNFDKAFYIFAIKVLFPKVEPVEGDDPNVRDIDGYWLQDYDISEFHGQDNIYNIKQFKTFEVEVDFNNPQAVQNHLIELTTEVEKLCPVTESLFGGVIPEDAIVIGEGIVWEHINPTGKKFTCKVKGDKHASSKVTKLASVDTEKLNSIAEFVEYAVSESRLEQAYETLFTRNNITPDMVNLGEFIKWVSGDVAKEESDTLADNGLTIKDVGSLLSKKSKTWFIAKLG